LSIPFLSKPIDELFYDNYQYDALEYSIDILNGLIVSYKKILNNPRVGAKISVQRRELYDKQLNILQYEIVAKLCHYIENLGAFAYAFTKSEKIKDIYDLICNYEVNWVTNFYRSFLRENKDTLTDRNKAKITKIFAYPQPTTESSKQKIDKSVVNIGKLLVEIGAVYVGTSDLKFKESYNSYKHGYRILPSVDTKTRKEVIIYLGQDGRPSLIPVDIKSMEIILKLKKYCRILFETLLNNNRIKSNLLIEDNFESFELNLISNNRNREYKIVKEKFRLSDRKARFSTGRVTYLIR
jgi:hypothetical protein